jgi:uncharacterized protein YvpB
MVFNKQKIMTIEYIRYKVTEEQRKAFIDAYNKSAQSASLNLPFEKYYPNILLHA